MRMIAQREVQNRRRTGTAIQQGQLFVGLMEITKLNMNMLEQSMAMTDTYWTEKVSVKLP